MKIRIGIEGGRKAVLDRASALGAPILVSANSLWDNSRKKFSGWKTYAAYDTALDSGGFVAMQKYGGYRWTITDYVLLAKAMQPAWWAQMDFCCEPQIAADPASVRHRIGLTVQHLQECQRIADGENVSMPLPVLQGWQPEDYCRGPIYETDFKWPQLVGIGSVCRRQLSGKDGLFRIIESLHHAVPAHCLFHLFGVKSDAIGKLLTEFPNRIASMDSMAWNMQARWDAYNQRISCDSELRANAAQHWYERQLLRVPKIKQPLLF